MNLLCPNCTRRLEFSGEPPKFCGYCGKPLPLSNTRTADFDPHDAATIALPPADQRSDDPAVIGNYRLLRQLGAGGMGAVYEAEDIATGRRVALKLIAASHTTSPEAVQRFRQEGRLASTIAHPRSVFVLAADEDAGRPYIVMELMPGSTLKDEVEKHGPLAPEQAVARILDVIDGLREAHRRGLIHRDVKPSNCFLEGNGRVKVGDFGLSKSLVGESHLTRTGAFLGTPLFASPEQIRRDPLDQQTDVYSVAATLYYLLTGRAPFDTGDAAATMARIVSESPPPVRNLRPDVPRALDEVVLHGLERSREQRWRNLEEFRAALLPFVPGQLSRGNLGVRFGAYLVDYLVVNVVLGLVNLVLASLMGALNQLMRPETAGQSQPLYFVGLLGWLAYYTVSEGVWGCSLGKWLMGLRVCRVAGTKPPGLRRALGRTLLFEMLTGLGSIPLLIVPYLEGAREGHRAESVAMSPTYMIAACLSYPLMAFGIGLVLCTMRGRNGYRGLHEFLSGTRVVRLPEPESRLTPRGGLEQAITRQDDLPDRVGPFVIEGALRWSAGTGVLLAEDPALGRKVVLWLRPATNPELSPVRRELVRRGRLRWLTCGRQGESQWDAFLAPTGGPLPALVVGEDRLPWSVSRLLLDQLAEELLAAQADGTLPPSLTVDQIWIEPDGRMLLLDMSLTSEPDAHKTDIRDPLDLLKQTAILALEGRPRTKGGSTLPIRAPLPPHAARIVNALLAAESEEATTAFQAGLAATRARPVEVTRPRRFAQLVVLSLFLFMGLSCCMLPMSSFPGYVVVLPSVFILHEGEQLERELEVVATGDFLASALDQNAFTRAHAVHRLEQDQLLRKRLSHWQKQVRAEHQAQLPSVGWGARMYVVMMEEQLRFQKQQSRGLDGRPLSRVRPKGVRAEARGLVDTQFSIHKVLINAYPTLLILLAGWPILWILWAFVVRGGLSYPLTGLALIRSDGRKAGRFQCAWRALLVWVPLTALLALSAGLEVLYWRDWKVNDPSAGVWLLWLASLVWWSVPTLLLAYPILALLSPTRSLLDRLAGSCVVPR